MKREDAIWILELIRNRDARTDAEKDAVNAAIEALKAQLSCEGTTSDLISRTETVERLHEVIETTMPITPYDGGYIDGIEVGISIVTTMPPIQSQSTTGQLNDSAQSTDLIDRQQAIDALIGISGSKSIEELTEECEVYQSDNRCWSGGVYGAIRAIKSLPPAQPEPTDIDAKEAVYNLAEKIGIHQLFALTVELRGEPIQPEPQEGHWIRRDCGLDVECKCSRCGYKDFVEPRDEYWFNRNFCPNCGAKMTISTK